MILIVILLVLTVFFQVVFLPLNLTLAIVLALIVSGIKKSTLLLIFFTGIFYDLILLQTIGITALFYLVISIIIYAYQLKFKNKNFFFLLFLSAIIFAFSDFFFSAGLNISKLLFEMIIFLLFYFFSQPILTEKDRRYPSL